MLLGGTWGLLGGPGGAAGVPWRAQIAIKHIFQYVFDDSEITINLILPYVFKDFESLPGPKSVLLMILSLWEFSRGSPRSPEVGGTTAAPNPPR